MSTSLDFNVQYSIPLCAQPTSMTCWSAATTMLFGGNFSAGPGKASLSSDGGLEADLNNIQNFARSYNLRLHYPQCWTVDGLKNLLTRGPIALLGPIPSLHAIVIGGIRGDRTDQGTVLTIYDPWPPRIGRKYEVSYQALMTQFPMATMYLLQR
jgi:hypothetical protein